LLLSQSDLIFEALKGFSDIYRAIVKAIEWQNKANANNVGINKLVNYVFSNTLFL
jgi:hypothetical protein